ncbi:unannotated protein [freshwater metagenome]|uniref:Unannotated protein n=1 Tax=freshwater metagenome TaxID=449393 RepID=A0A6J7RHV8_9ZZZZ
MPDVSSQLRNCCVRRSQAFYPEGVSRQSAHQQSADQQSADQESAVQPSAVTSHVFDRTAAERVMHRAVHLAADQELEESVDGISEQALIEAAAELGVDISVVQQAAVEERLGLLVQKPQRGDSLVGPAVVTVSRIVPGRPEDVLESVDSWLRKAGSLQRQRSGSLSAKYSQRTGFAASVDRSARSVMGTEELGLLPSLSVSTAAAQSGPLGEPSALVALSADLHAERSAAVVGAAGTAILGSAFAMCGVVAAVANGSGGGALDMAAGIGLAMLALLGIPISCALGYGVLVLRARRISTTEDSLNGILDQVATGTLPSSTFGHMADRLLRSLRSLRSPRPGPPV